MSRIFLGPLTHWLLAAAVVGLGWLSGIDRLHVSRFNPFLIFLLVVTVVILLIVLRTSRPGDQVTRDPIEEDD